jgi:hypothetical protein
MVPKMARMAHYYHSRHQRYRLRQVGRRSFYGIVKIALKILMVTKISEIPLTKVIKTVFIIQRHIESGNRQRSGFTENLQAALKIL